MKVSIARLGVLVAAVLMAMHVPALAHHPMGGQVPQTLIQGFLSGLGHPVIGLDHLGAIIGVGVLAAFAARGIGPVLAFSIAVIAGVALHLAKADIPAGELLVGLSTLAIGALVILRQSISPAVAAALFAVAGLIHGHALGESIVGAEPTPLAAYLAGLLVIQTVIGAAAYIAVRNRARWPALLRSAGLTVVGILVALAGGVTAAFAAGLVN